ncbi:Serine/threonine-protein phosphatase PP1 isozyme 1, partial [Toxocara canis]
VKVDDMLCRILSVGKENCGLAKTMKEFSHCARRYLLSENVRQQFCPMLEKVTFLAPAAPLVYQKEVFLSQSIFIEIDPPARICGDTHGQYGDVLRLFHRGGFPPQSNYLFLGDYVDRGGKNLDVFEVMPFTGCVGDLILCMHGGISTLLKEFQQVDQHGYEFFGNRRLVTIFFAPHYYGQFDNAAAIMYIYDDLVFFLPDSATGNGSESFRTLQDSSQKIREAHRRGEPIDCIFDS